MERRSKRSGAPLMGRAGIDAVAGYQVAAWDHTGILGDKE